MQSHVQRTIEFTKVHEFLEAIEAKHAELTPPVVKIFVESRPVDVRASSDIEEQLLRLQPILVDYYVGSDAETEYNRFELLHYCGDIPTRFDQPAKVPSSVRVAVDEIIKVCNRLDLDYRLPGEGNVDV